MAIKGAWTNLFLKWGTTDLSDHVKTFVFGESDTPVDVTAHGDTARINKGSGIPAWAGSVTFHQDFAASSVHATLQAAAGTAAGFALAFRPSTAAAGAGNEQMTGTAIVDGYTGFQGSVGENAEAELTFVSGSAITSSTST